MLLLVLEPAPGKRSLRVDQTTKADLAKRQWVAITNRKFRDEFLWKFVRRFRMIRRVFIHARNIDLLQILVVLSTHF
jgi:hypothetical protein